jgi:hypothetical protein
MQLGSSIPSIMNFQPCDHKFQALSPGSLNLVIKKFNPCHPENVNPATRKLKPATRKFEPYN